VADQNKSLSQKSKTQSNGVTAVTSSNSAPCVESNVGFRVNHMEGFVAKVGVYDEALVRLKTPQVPIKPPNFGNLVGDSFAPAMFKYYGDYLFVRYTGTKNHKPAAHVISTTSQCDREWMLVCLTQGPLPPDVPPNQIVLAGRILLLEAKGFGVPTPQPWYESQDLINQPMTYFVQGWADYNGGGAGRDSAVLITGKSYTNGVWLQMGCDDYPGAGGLPPDFDCNDKIIEMFFQLTYGSDYNRVTLTPPTWDGPLIVTIS
jgi:hypothetical protein